MIVPNCMRWKRDITDVISELLYNNMSTVLTCIECAFMDYIYTNNIPSIYQNIVSIGITGNQPHNNTTAQTAHI